jgi:hypothetical protein
MNKKLIKKLVDKFCIKFLKEVERRKRRRKKSKLLPQVWHMSRLLPKLIFGSIYSL